jgi:uncharacterized damage-inducible protein DinB
MNEFYKELFEYNYCMNQALGAYLHEHADKVSEKTMKLFSHCISAHQIWNNRIAPQQSPFTVWQLHNSKDFKSIDQHNYEHTLLVLQKTNLNEIIQYNTSNGQTFTNSIQSILFHVINHSTYHRGQIASDLKQGGLEPLNTDYIIYKRK